MIEEAQAAARRALADSVRMYMPRGEVERIADAVTVAVLKVAEPVIRADERDRMALPGDDRP